MASVELDKKVSLELQEGEAVFFAHKVYHWTGFLAAGAYNFAITNQRIALVPYKAGKEIITINYEDIYRAKITKIVRPSEFTHFNVYMKEKTKLLGFIPVHAAKKFELRGTLGESLLLTGKEFLRELKNSALILAEGMENQQKGFAIDADSHIYNKDAAKREARKKIASYWNQYSDKAEEKMGGGKKPTPVQRAQFLVNTVNEIVTLVG